MIYKNSLHFSHASAVYSQDLCGVLKLHDKIHINVSYSEVFDELSTVKIHIQFCHKWNDIF